MKKLLLITLLALPIISCQDKAKTKQESGSAVSLEGENAAKAEINFASNPIAERYRTVITEKYDELEVNFASYYVIVTWGCGSGCVTGAMVDTRDGAVYSMPDDKEWGGNGTYIDSKKESEILLTVAVAQSPTGQIEETRKYWQWHEGLKKFEFDKVESVLIESDQ
ncbi:MAG: hypothetical protein WBN56_11835 [Robiginitalea sp.]|uniref:hypothetical protein n=1 Tax=Robiginitalea sp. TaxID=1902411 RepID=UPI003C796E53